MSIHMTTLAQPDYFEWLGVVSMMSFDFAFYSALGARLRTNKFSFLNSAIKSVTSLNCDRIVYFMCICCSPFAHIVTSFSAILFSGTSSLRFVFVRVVRGSACSPSP